MLVILTNKLFGTYDIDISKLYAYANKIGYCNTYIEVVH